MKVNKELSFRNVILKVLLALSHNTYGYKLNELENEKCYEGLGCVRLTSEWFDPRYRAENVLPADRHVVNTIFVQWTLNNQNLTNEILGTRLEGTNIKSCLKILVHDFTSNGFTGWVQHLTRAFLTHPSTMCSNIVSVDWAAGAEPPYLTAVANARLVALEIVHFLHKLKAVNKVEDCNVHIIGHGLGGHIAGYVGKLTKVNKITALDPSGPYFTKMPPQVKLHRNDAFFVEVVHTDVSTYGQGIPDFLGHVDFFPNGGKHQPGCQDLRKKLTNVKRGDLQLGQTLSACSHKRSLKYYIESVMNKNCKFVAVACTSFKDFVQGKCLSCGEQLERCTSLGPTSALRALNNTFGFYFVTSDSMPFCSEMIKVFMSLSRTSSSHGFVKGYFKVTIPQTSGDVSFWLNENQRISTLRTDTQHTFVVFRCTPPHLVLPARTIQIQWVDGLLCYCCSEPRITGITFQKMTDDSCQAIQHFCPERTPRMIGNKDSSDKMMSLEPCSNTSAHYQPLSLIPTLTSHIVTRRKKYR